MKKMMMTLAAVVVASMASAVTYSWSGTKVDEATSIDTSTATFKTDKGDAIKIVGDFTLAINIKMDAAWDAAFINPIFKLSAENDKGTVFFKSNNENSSSDKHVAYLNISGEDKNLGGHFTQSRMQDVTFTIDFKNYNAEANTYTVTFTASGGWNNGTNMSESYTNVAIGADEILFNGLFLDNNVKEFSMELSGAGVLPEPTVMALLALGVAGVALRRKQA